jgi:hypothetical protein
MISPKVRIKNVITPIAMPTPKSPKYSMAIEVANADAAMFTILFPISTVVRKASGSFTSFWTVSAPFTPLFSKYLAFTRPILIRAVSEPEKNPDSSSNTNRTIISTMNHDTVFFVPSSYIYVLGTYKFIAGILEKWGTQGKI